MVYLVFLFGHIGIYVCVLVCGVWYMVYGIQGVVDFGILVWWYFCLWCMVCGIWYDQYFGVKGYGVWL